MMTIKIQGGLGNQLFQIFTLISTSIENNRPFHFINEKEPYRLDRPFYWTNFLECLSQYISTAESNFDPNFVYREPYFHYKTISCTHIPADKSIFLLGYFQSHKYFHNNKETIFKLIKLEEQKNRLLEKYKPSFFQNTISLHFRIGDYINYSDAHPILQLDYYISAISELIRITGKDKWKILFLYELKDKDKVQRKINQLKHKFSNLEFQSIDHDLQDWEQLLMMSLCQHNIIANSTFSWWGAYLNENDNKVFYPGKWFGTNRSKFIIDDLFIDNWIKINID